MSTPQAAAARPDPGTADLAALRRSRGMTVAQVAERVGRSERHVFRVESGELLPDDPLLWAKVYGTTKGGLARACRCCVKRPARRPGGTARPEDGQPQNGAAVASAAM